MRSGDFFGSFSGTIVEVRTRKKHDGQQGTNYYQDLIVRDGDDERDILTLTLVNRKEVFGNGLNAEVVVEGPNGNNAAIKCEDNSRFGFKAKAYKSANILINGHSLPYSREENTGPQSERDSRPSAPAPDKPNFVDQAFYAWEIARCLNDGDDLQATFATILIQANMQSVTLGPADVERARQLENSIDLPSAEPSQEPQQDGSGGAPTLNDEDIPFIQFDRAGVVL